MNNDHDNDIKISPEMGRLFALARGAALSADEKARGLSSLLALMSAPPAMRRRQMTLREFFLASKPRSFVIAAALLMIAGGGVIGRANETLPGDVLYPVKINFNEKLQSLSALSVAERARVETIQAAERLQEAETLTVLGRLTPETQKAVEENFDRHARKIAADTSALRQEGDAYSATLVSSDFESALSSHRDILERLAKSNATGSPVVGLAAAVKEKLRETASARSQAEATLATSTDGTDIKGIALKADDESKKSLNNAVKTVDREGKKRGAKAESAAKQEISQAASYRSEAEAELKSGDYAKAVILFGKAHRGAKKVQIKTESESELKDAADQATLADKDKDRAKPEIKPAATAVTAASSTAEASSTASTSPQTAPSPSPSPSPAPSSKISPSATPSPSPSPSPSAGANTSDAASVLAIASSTDTDNTASAKNAEPGREHGKSKAKERKKKK